MSWSATATGSRSEVAEQLLKNTQVPTLVREAVDKACEALPPGKQLSVNTHGHIGENDGNLTITATTVVKVAEEPQPVAETAPVVEDPA